MFISYTNRTTVDKKLNVKNDWINVILVAGVNDSGKTISIDRIVCLLKKQQKVLIASADTFWAGAVQQLEIWSKRIGVDIIKPIKSYMDPSVVVYNGINLVEKIIMMYLEFNTLNCKKGNFTYCYGLFLINYLLKKCCVSRFKKLF